MSNVVLYNPMHEIILFSGAKHYLPSDKFDGFKKALLERKFVEINGELINVSSIERVRKAVEEISVLETLLAGKSESLKENVRGVIEARKKDGFRINEQIISNIIEKYENNGSDNN